MRRLRAFYQGRLDEARRWLEEAWSGYRARPAGATASPSWPLPHDPVPVTAVALACVAGLQGRAEESGEWERQAIATSDDLGFPTGPFSAAFVATSLAWLRMVTGDPAGARHFGRRTLEIAERCRFDYFQLIGRQYVLVPEPGRPSDPTELEQCEAGMDLVGHGAFRPSFLGIVARNHTCLGDPGRALHALDDALAGARASGELIHQPDLLRLRAEITLAAHPDRTNEVIADLVTALDVGLAQGSLVLALRAAIDLARLPIRDRPSDWSGRLRSVLDRVPPGSSSPAVAEAQALFGA
jgi:hypothetical protein